MAAPPPAESLMINVCVPQTERHLKAPQRALARHRTGAKLIAVRGNLYDPGAARTTAVLYQRFAK